MTVERQMQYLKLRLVFRERPVTLSDFDDLLYEDHNIFQLFEYQGQQRRDLPLYMFEMILDKAWGLKEHSLPYGVLLTQFPIDRGVMIGDRESCKKVPLKTRVLVVPPPLVAQLFGDLDSRVNAIVWPLEDQVENLEREIKWLQEDYEKLWRDFDGECTVTMMRNNAVMAYMKNVMDK
ncbi:hypothetical protein CJ030_MR8G020279 [Morella rubra]|uniref:Uncharacterized protein n=1 Tax=Morella rubra TaxID=262757 RepID=A0A6A1UQN6_9ROSI|nr:hypothetical protein CJ030_MR8G020279 [Morella rubra]